MKRYARRRSAWSEALEPVQLSDSREALSHLDTQIAFWDALLSATVATAAWRAFVEQNQWEAEYLPNAAFVKHLQSEEKRLRAPLTDLGLTKQ